MPIFERLTDAMGRFTPAKSKTSRPMAAGIGNGGHGMVPFNDGMIVSKPAIVFHSAQIFFNFLAMACFASVAAFQGKWGVGPSGLTGFALFISITGMFLSAFMLIVPVFNEKYDKFVRLARMLKEVRVSFILTSIGTAASLLIAFIVTISAWTQPGCKDPNKDPHAKAKGSGFKNGLDGFCSSKKAGAIFFWLAFGAWLASSVLLILDWRSGKLYAAPRDPPFVVPEVNEEGEDEDTTYISPSNAPPVSTPHVRYDPPNNSANPFADSNRYSSPSPAFPTAPTSTTSVPASRPSIDAYGAFSDPAPSGFNPSSPTHSNGNEQPRMSRTMQYADPYAAVRTSVAGAYAPSVPPSYESYTGYR